MSRRMVIPVGIKTVSPSEGKGPPPHVDDLDQRLTYYEWERGREREVGGRQGEKRRIMSRGLHGADCYLKGQRSGRRRGGGTAHGVSSGRVEHLNTERGIGVDSGRSSRGACDSRGGEGGDGAGGARG